MTDFLNYKFRCSGLGNLLVDPRSKTEPLSETTKTYLRELWIKETFGREKIIATKYMDKGIAVESDSLDLVKTVLGKTYFKNQKRLENDWLTGTPDAIDEEYVLDIKSSWDLWTFASVDEDKAKKDYYGQLLGYMLLTGKKTSNLAYCLVNTPQEQVTYELYKLTVSGAIKDTPEEQDKAKMNFVFDDIEPEKRIKMFQFAIDDAVVEKLINRIKVARFYMNSLSL